MSIFLTLPEQFQTMALNPQYDAIGKAFVQQYYTLFDDAAQRHQLVNLYNVSSKTLILFASEWCKILEY